MFTRAENADVSVNCAISVPRDRLQVLSQLVKADGINLDAVLPEEVTALCAQIMRDWNQDSLYSSEAPLLEEYLFLRGKLDMHERMGLQPKLRLLSGTAGGWDTFKRNLAEKGVDVDRMMSDITNAASSPDAEWVGEEERDSE